MLPPLVRLTASTAASPRPAGGRAGGTTAWIGTPVVVRPPLAVALKVIGRCGTAPRTLTLAAAVLACAPEASALPPPNPRRSVDGRILNARDGERVTMRIAAT